MTSFERVSNALERKKVDQLPFCDALWGETIALWKQQGHIHENQTASEHFSFDIARSGGINSQADMGKEQEILEEDKTSILFKNGNGATLRKFKDRTGTPEHVDFAVKERSDWEEKIKPFLIDVDRRRIPFEFYRLARKQANEQQRFFTFGGLLPFEQMHPVCGHEYLLMGMALAP